MKKWSFIVAAVLGLPVVALAQSADAPVQTTFLGNLFWTLLPIVLIVVIFWFVFIRVIRKLQRTQIQEYRQHREKVEQLLERIAKAVEERNGIR